MRYKAFIGILSIKNYNVSINKIDEFDNYIYEGCSKIIETFSLTSLK